MKISELERNVITRGEAAFYPFPRKKFTGELPFNIDSYDILYKKHAQQGISGIVVAVFDEEKLVANLFLTPFDYLGIKCYNVEYAAVSPEYGGQNIGYELYRGLVVLSAIPLISVVSQSKGARKLWLKLAQDPKITAYGFTIEDKVVFHLQPNKTQTELKSLKAKVKLYDNYDSGMILVIKGGPLDRKLSKISSASQKKFGYFDKEEFGKVSKMATASKPDIFGIKKYKPLK